MLAAPYGNTGMTTEEAQPWLRQVWDYANHRGRYAGEQYEFNVYVVDKERSWTNVACKEPLVEHFRPCDIYELNMADKYLTDAYRNSVSRIVVHEFSHMFTLSSRIAFDDVSEPRPDLNAIAHLYFTMEYGCPDVKRSELLADAVATAAVPSYRHYYWDDCGYDAVPDEAVDVGRSLLAGEYPQWFIDTYGLGDGQYALRQLWADYRAHAESRGTYWTLLWAWQMRDAFGFGYCEPLRAADAVYRGGTVANPWSSGDDDGATCS